MGEEIKQRITQHLFCVCTLNQTHRFGVWESWQSLGLESLFPVCLDTAQAADCQSRDEKTLVPLTAPLWSTSHLQVPTGTKLYKVWIT